MATHLRFLKQRSGAADLPAGIAVRYAVCSDVNGQIAEPRIVFDLEKPHLGGGAQCRGADGQALTVDWSAREPGTWRLIDAGGAVVAVASRRGGLKSGIRLTSAQNDVLAEFVDPASVSRQILRSVLNGSNCTYLCLAGDKPLGQLVRLPRGGQRSAGMLGRLKGLVATHDWVFVSEEAAGFGAREEHLVPVVFAALVAIVDLEFADA